VVARTVTTAGQVTDGRRLGPWTVAAGIDHNGGRIGEAKWLCQERVTDDSGDASRSPGQSMSR
jgi:hypothetical protein